MTSDGNRREFFVRSAAALGLAGRVSAAGSAADPPAPSKTLPAPRRIAMVNSIYRFRSHAYHLGRHLLDGYDREGVLHRPPIQLVRMFNHQSPPDDLTALDSRRYGFEAADSVAAALCGGETRGDGTTGSGTGKKLDVDGVLLVVEHGDYPTNEYEQVLYPRFELFEEIVKIFEATGRSVPVFVDKHLSYDSSQARRMVETARRLHFGLMAGSSLPVTWRRPELEPPLETPFQEGLVAFGFDRGPTEIYFFHALETLQCLLERRAGGETGVRSVTGLSGDAVWKAGDDGLWSWSLLDAALGRNPSLNPGDVRANVRHPQAILVEYADGTRGAVLNLIDAVSEFSFAGRVAGQDAPLSTWFVLPPPPGAKFFDCLMGNIEKFLASGTPPYPVERTLLTSTVLDLGMRSLKEGKPRGGEALDIRYRAPQDSGFFRGRYTRDA